MASGVIKGRGRQGSLGLRHRYAGGVWTGGCHLGVDRCIVTAHGKGHGRPQAPGEQSAVGTGRGAALAGGALPLPWLPSLRLGLGPTSTLACLLGGVGWGRVSAVDGSPAPQRRPRAPVAEQSCQLQASWSAALWWVEND